MPKPAAARTAAGYDEPIQGLPLVRALRSGGVHYPVVRTALTAPMRSLLVGVAKAV